MWASIVFACLLESSVRLLPYLSSSQEDVTDGSLTLSSLYAAHPFAQYEKSACSSVNQRVCHRPVMSLWECVSASVCGYEDGEV